MEPRGENAREIDALAMELADRAESRSPLGNARIQLGEIDAIEPRRSPYRQVSVLERDLRATEATVRHELSMSLGNRVNIVGEGAEIATHRIEGEFLRSAKSLELSLRLVEIKSDWIVATARRRIDDFVPEHYDRRMQPAGSSAGSSIPPAVQGSTASQSKGPKSGTLSAARSRTRALRPAYPVPGRDALSSPGVTAENAADDAMTEAVPKPTTVLSADKKSESLGRFKDAASAVESGAPIEFESGPAAARLRATGALPVKPNSTPENALEN